MGIFKRLYLCDRMKSCRDRIGCSRNGGECRHTQDIEHAVNGGFTVKEENGELIVPDNVEIFRRNDGNIILIEEEGK